MNELAIELNEMIEGTLLSSVLSEKAKRFYFPKGIISQSQEASGKANYINATIGAGLEDGKPMMFPFVKSLVPELSEKEIVSYAPTTGVKTLRESWLKDMRKKNPSLSNSPLSLPMVTNGLTHGVNLAAEMFINPGDNVVYPDFFWGNYNLIFKENHGAKVNNFPLFSCNKEFNTDALKELLSKFNDGEKVMLVLNFPNNPTGYSPSKKCVDEIVNIIRNEDRRLRLVILTDDAYFGLFYEEDTCKESIFSKLVHANGNYVLVKGDACTKEYLAWGFRVGFITYWVKEKQEKSYYSLEKKTAGLIRYQVSSCCHLSQSIMERLLNYEDLEIAKDRVYNVMKERYKIITKALSKYKDDDILIPLGYNSGYFLTLEYKSSADKLRISLLEKQGVGVISIRDKYIRVAFSSVDNQYIEPLVDAIFKEAKVCK